VLCHPVVKKSIWTKARTFFLCSIRYTKSSSITFYINKGTRDIAAFLIQKKKLKLHIFPGAAVLSKWKIGLPLGHQHQ
jgi:SET domain-containing protein